MSDINWKSALTYANLINISEEVGSDKDYSYSSIEKIKELGYLFIEPIFGKDRTSNSAPILLFGFICLSDEKELVIVMRGTDTFIEWLKDFEFLLSESLIKNCNGKIEHGFSDLYTSLKTINNTEILLKDKISLYIENGTATTITVCGHSLGGALSTLVGLDISLNTSGIVPSIYTFASPKVGNSDFVNLFNKTISNSYRIVNDNDLIPEVPLKLLNYRHVDSNFVLTSKQNNTKDNVVANHHITTYIELISELLKIN